MYPVRTVAALSLLTLAMGCGQDKSPPEAAPSAPLAQPVPIAQPAKREEAPKPPAPKKDLDYTNVLLITVDTLRADHLGCYGYDKTTTPNLDALAKDGAVFEFTMAPKGSTWPSLATILTGLYPVTHGVRVNGMHLDSKHDTLAELLKPAGYAGAVFIANGGNQAWEGFDTLVKVKEEPRDRVLTDAALEWLDGNADKKFFLWLHYFAPHGPYEPPKEFHTFTDPNYKGDIDGSYDALTRVFVRKRDLSPEDLAYVKGLYDGEVAFTDHEIGRVIDKVASLGILDDTMVVFSADHGEELYDHHYYFHHQASLYEGVLRVPLIVRWPEKVQAGRKITQPVSLADIAPTILELLGMDRPAVMEGISLVPAIAGEPLERGPVFGEWSDKMLYIRTAEHKYIYNPTGFQPPVKREREQAEDTSRLKGDHTLPIRNRELYAIQQDPREQSDISEASAEVVAALEAQLKSGYIDKYGWKLDANVEGALEQQLDEETRKELEALGYVVN